MTNAHHHLSPTHKDYLPVLFDSYLHWCCDFQSSVIVWTYTSMDITTFNGMLHKIWQKNKGQDFPQDKGYSVPVLAWYFDFERLIESLGL